MLRGVPHTMDTPQHATHVQVTSQHRRYASGVEVISAKTHGFVGADLQLLVKEAALQALRRTCGGGLQECLGQHADSDESQEDVGQDYAQDAVCHSDNLPLLTLPDFLASLTLVSPSGLREVAVEVPTVRWTNIGGMDGVKQSLREVVEWPLRHPEAFQRMGISPPKGVLLYGPPGCSKTLMARALATESGMNFLAVKGQAHTHSARLTDELSGGKVLA